MEDVNEIIGGDSWFKNINSKWQLYISLINTEGF